MSTDSDTGASGMPPILRKIFARWRASDRVLADVALDDLPAHVAANPADHHAAQYWANITRYLREAP